MPPLSRAVIETLVKEHRVVLFSKTWCPFCNKVKELFNSKFIPYHKIELDKHPEGELYQTLLSEFSGQQTVPNVYIGGQHIGGCDDTLKLQEDGKLLPLVNPQSVSTHDYTYDLVVIGGGSGGLAASKEAASLGKKSGSNGFR